MFSHASLICAGAEIQGAPLFRKIFSADAGAVGTFTLGGLGTYDVFLNGEKIGGDVLSPGWQHFDKRICTTTYALKNLQAENTLTVLLTAGWYAGRINRGDAAFTQPRAIIGEISLGEHVIGTDASWEVSPSTVRFSDIYDGIVCDANVEEKWQPVLADDAAAYPFVPDTTVPMREFDTVYPCEIIHTPAGETVLDFGVNLVGYPVVSLSAKRGERVRFSFAEILDKDGNFYNKNYRNAKCQYDYTCRDGAQSFTPRGTFYGFRYLRVDEFPAGANLTESVFARVVHADMVRTGDIHTGNALLNRLFENTLRGQLGNYLCVPTDCPQRDERRGWTGDAQIFIKAAAYNFDVLPFFRSWMIDICAQQTESGLIPTEVPFPLFRCASLADRKPRAAWSDAVTICPYELYLAYGDRAILEDNYDAMCRHIDAMTAATTEPDLFCGCEQFGDWLGLDAPFGSYKGASSEDMIASAYYAYSTELVCRIGSVLHKDTARFETLYRRIRAAFVRRFEPTLATQTECAVALHFHLIDHPEEITRRLVARIHAAGDKLETGFVGTPYILHALSANGEAELAYTLLLNTEFPSWLYPVTMGATTMWEHWDGLRPDGVLWSDAMNSYNHYAYGAVMDWVYSVAAGIRPEFENPGYAHATIAPLPDKRLGTLDVTFDSVHGAFRSSWYYEGDTPHYSITTPVAATIVIDGKAREVLPGMYVF